jgi:hypothetical protein
MFYVSSPEKIWLIRSFFKAAVSYTHRVVLLLGPAQCLFYLAQQEPAAALILKASVFFEEYSSLPLAV